MLLISVLSRWSASRISAKRSRDGCACGQLDPPGRTHGRPATPTSSTNLGRASPKAACGSRVGPVGITTGRWIDWSSFRKSHTSRRFTMTGMCHVHVTVGFCRLDSAYLSIVNVAWMHSPDTRASSYLCLYRLMDTAPEHASCHLWQNPATCGRTLPQVICHGPARGVSSIVGCAKELLRQTC